MPEALNQFIVFLPRLLLAILFVILAWLVATGVRILVRRGLEKARVDERLSRRQGLKQARPSLSKTISQASYWLIWLLFLPLIFYTLNLEPLLVPFADIGNAILAFLPNLIAAILILFVGWILGRIVQGLLTNALAAAGFDRLAERMGMRRLARSDAQETRQEISETRPTTTPSSVVGVVAFIAIMLFALTAAFRALGIVALEVLMADLLVFAGQIFMGLIIFGVGILLANWAGRIVATSQYGSANVLGQLTRAAILILAGAMALRQMGLANEIVTLAFAFLIGAVAIAAAIAFGIGGRHIAADVLADWRRKAERDEVPPPVV
jgi:hypothetical protein